MSDQAAVHPILVNARDAAVMLSICPRVLWTMTNCRAIPHLKIGRSVRYAVADLQRWVEANKIKERPREALAPRAY